jgi:hypothetical protein
MIKLFYLFAVLIEVPLEDPGVRVHCNLHEDDLCITNSTAKLDCICTDGKR